MVTLNNLINKRIEPGHYQVNVSWEYLLEKIHNYEIRKNGIAALNINPDFQRGHVWTRKQQIAYIEFKLSGGTGSDIIYFNCAGWMDDFKGPFVLVDGKQRLEAIRLFIENLLPVFGNYFLKDFEDKEIILRKNDVIFNINNLKNYNDVLKWYLEMNSGGTPHTKTELEKVKRMIKN